jgi:hypothetical protein
MKWDRLHGGTYIYSPLSLGEIRVLHLLAQCVKEVIKVIKLIMNIHDYYD